MGTNGAAGLAPVAANTYEMVANPIGIGNGLNNTRGTKSSGGWNTDFSGRFVDDVHELGTSGKTARSCAGLSRSRRQSRTHPGGRDAERR